MTESARLVVLLHLDLAPGTLPAEADRLWRECFQPLIGALHHTPTVKVGIVLAGESVEELDQRHPEGIEWLRGLVDRGQVELVGTAQHEPVLSSVPERDAIGQIQAHATLIKRVFGVRPTGCWLPHGVWDPAIPRILVGADMTWTVIDDRIVSGVMPDDHQVWGAYRAEREGCVVALMALDARVREAAPEVSVRQVLSHLERRARRGNTLVAFALSASRFADKRDQSWLATLLLGMSQMAPAIETRTPSEAIAAIPSRGRVYVPSGAPKDQQVPWERCLLRYEEANRLHKRMIRVSRMVERLARMVKDSGSTGWRPDPSHLIQANRYLHRAQAAPVFTHGPHPGIYDPRRRQLAWRDILRAERVAMDAMRLDERMAIETSDIDCDGNEDILLRTPGVVAVIDRAHSAGLIELSIPAIARNLVDTLTRKEEPYHRQLGGLGPEDDRTEDAPTRLDSGAKVMDDEPTLAGISPKWLEAEQQRELSRALALDKRPRVSFVEHMIGPDVTVGDMQKGLFTSIGKGLKEIPWTLVSAERHGADALRAVLCGEGAVEELGGERSVQIHKRYTVHRAPMIDVRIELLNRGHDALRTRLALELDLAPASSGDPLYLAVGNERRSANAIGDLGEATDITLTANDLLLTLSTKKPVRVWHYPIETVHRDGAKMVLGHQGVCVVLIWPIELFGQEKVKLDVTLRVEV